MLQPQIIIAAEIKTGFNRECFQRLIRAGGKQILRFCQAEFAGHKLGLASGRHAAVEDAGSPQIVMRTVLERIANR